MQSRRSGLYIKKSTGGEGGYTIRIGVDKANNYEFLLYLMSYVYILGIGSSRWATLNNTKLVPGLNHCLNEGNDFRAHSSARADSKDSCISYLHDIDKMRRSTRASFYEREDWCGTQGRREGMQ
jgi:hypothetical protein